MSVAVRIGVVLKDVLPLSTVLSPDLKTVTHICGSAGLREPTRARRISHLRHFFEAKSTDTHLVNDEIQLQSQKENLSERATNLKRSKCCDRCLTWCTS